MVDEKEIFYTMIDREIDNIFCNLGPISMFSSAAKRLLRSYTEPYINMFLENGKIQTEQASEFVNEEIQQKIKSFKDRFNNKVKEADNEEQ